MAKLKAMAKAKAQTVGLTVLTRQEAAQALRVSTREVDRLAQVHALEKVSVGKRAVRITVASIEQFLGIPLRMTA